MKYTNFLIFFSFLLISCINKEPKVYLCDAENKEDLNYFQNILQEDYPNYKFDKKNFFNGRNNIIEKLVEYENKINSKNINYQKINDIETDCYSDEIFNHISINAHIQRTNRD